VRLRGASRLHVDLQQWHDDILLFRAQPDEQPCALAGRLPGAFHLLNVREIMPDVLIGLHWHENEKAAGLEVACECGAVLLALCDPDGLLQLSELNSVAETHRDSCH
jgi:hypothetical protein